jgi:hypothetical protein
MDKKNWSEILPAPELYFKPMPFLARNYDIEPSTSLHLSALDLVFCWGNLEQVAEFALKRQGFMNSDSGLGLEYPIRPEKAGLIRQCWWEYKPLKEPNSIGRSKYKVKIRKFYMPESIYLGALVGVLRSQGYVDLANAIDRTNIIEPVRVEYLPSIYDTFNYRFSEYSRECSDCLVMVLLLKDLLQTRALASSRQGFEGQNRLQLRYQDDATLLLSWANDTETTVSEFVYLEVLNRVLILHNLEPG